MKRHLIYLLILAWLITLRADSVFCSKPASEKGGKKKNPLEKKEIKLTWYKYDEGLAKAKKEKKHIMVHFYATWCGWCKRMDRYTFGNEGVRKVLNESYVAIKVNGQSGEKVKVNDREITERQLAGKYGVRAYPVTWFLKPSGERIAPRRGYAGAEEFLYILNWVKDDLYDKISFGQFVKQQQKKEKAKKK